MRPARRWSTGVDERRGRHVLAILLGLAALHGASTALARPPFQVSDEIAYFSTIQLTTIERPGIDPAFRRRAAPPEGHPVLAVTVTKPAFRHSGAWLFTWVLGFAGAQTALLLLRLVFSLSGVLTVLATFLLARQMFPGNPFVVMGAPFVVAVHPVFMMFAAGVTPDALANALSAVALVLALRFAGRTSRRFEPLAMLAAAGAAIAIKDTAFFLIAVIPLSWAARTLAWWQERRRVRPDGWILLGPIALGFLLVSAPVAGWLGSSYLSRVAPLLQGPERSLTAAAIEIGRQWQTAFTTFWSLGEFGGNRPLLPHALVVVAAVFTGLAVLGLVRYAVAPPTWEPATSRRSNLALTGVALLSLVALALQPPLRNLLLGTDDVFQGRWMFPGLPLLAVLGCVGLSSFLRTPARGLPLLSTLASMLPVIAFAGVILPTYYRTFPFEYAMSRLYLLGSYGSQIDPVPVEALVARPAWASSWPVAWLPLCGLALLLVTWNVLALRFSSRLGNAG